MPHCFGKPLNICIYAAFRGFFSLIENNNTNCIRSSDGMLLWIWKEIPYETNKSTNPFIPPLLETEVSG
jgi:hypothetical protein